jgi:hypothetical protein
MRACAILLGCVLAAAGACGAEGPPPARTGAPAILASPPGGPGDAVVATVDGRPVWASCVAAQAARGAPTRRAALGECVDFELLARAAEARGLARDPDPELREALRAAMVGRLVETGFEDRYRSPADLRAAIDREIDLHHAQQLELPELRASAYARIEVPAGAPPEADAAARALAERIAAALADETGLFPVNLRETADRIAAGSEQTVLHGQYRAASREGLVPGYSEALYSIPAVGRVAAPARSLNRASSMWDWQVILLTQLVPPQVHTRDEIAAKLFPDLRRRQFYRWVNELAGSLGARVEIDLARVAQLLEEPR